MQLDRKVGYDIGLVIANELYSGIDVVFGCFPEGGDSTVSVFSSALLRAKL